MFVGGEGERRGGGFRKVESGMVPADRDLCGRSRKAKLRLSCGLFGWKAVRAGLLNGFPLFYLWREGVEAANGHAAVVEDEETRFGS